MSDSTPPLDRDHVLVEDDRTGMNLETLKRAFLDNLLYEQGRFFEIATPNDLYMAVAHTARDRMLHRWINTVANYDRTDIRVVCYLSAEFMPGPHLANNLINLGIYDRMREALQAYGIDLEELVDHEEEPGLGNGGLGRLAACYLDSLATLEIPAIGYGIRYEFGIFDQEIRDGWQEEVTDKWLHLGNPWEIVRPEIAFEVKLGGHTEAYHDEDGNYRVRWIPNRVVKGIAHDTPIVGFGVNTCNTLRLWAAEAVESFDFEAFNTGDYYRAVEDKIGSENLTKVLYPNDEPEAGKQLRLEQQYFFVSCALQDMIRLHRLGGGSLDTFHQMFTAQLNDTHPAVAVAELMRLLVDEHRMDWDRAWEITRKTFAYTNHTLLPEALERWPVELFRRLLPRHLEIIYEINHRFLETVRQHYSGDNERVARLSIIDENDIKSIRMAHLACVGSHSINGVAALHTKLLEASVLRDFYELMPDKFSNKTNGVSPRRFMVLSNPDLSALISREIGDDWIIRLEELRRLEPLAEAPAFQAAWQQVKRDNKQQLANRIRRKTGIAVDPDSLFDIQVKRIHEYKRQLLNLLHIISVFLRIKANPEIDILPRTFIFGGKAAPGYRIAKLTIKLINSVADVLNSDPDVRDRLKVVFFPDFNVKNAHYIYPAADLSEQISTAGKEASGTGNMKFALNGALTIGTLDGANIEIREEVGPENFFLFGLTADEVATAKAEGYNPYHIYQTDPMLKAAVDAVAAGRFSTNDPHLFKPLVDRLLHGDEYLVLADYAAYLDCQEQVDRAYRDRTAWTRKSILNTARMGRFSSDRAIREYCEDIWKVKPVPVELSEQANGALSRRQAADGKAD
jgi:starch phosphorylase